MAYLHLMKKYDPTNSMPTVKGIIGGSTVSLWFNSCSKRCKGCWNSETWGRNKRLYVPNDKVIEQVLEALDEFFPKHLSILGGDPLEASFEEEYKNNIQDTYIILKEVKRIRPQTKVICWTGYTWEECMEIEGIKKLLEEELIDILIDGRFEIDNKIENKMYGSSNQRVINVKSSLQINQIITYENI